MTDTLPVLGGLAADELDRLSALLAAGRLTLASGGLGLVGEGFAQSQQLATELSGLGAEGFSERQAAILLKALAEAHRRSADATHHIEVVVTGPDAAGTSRDTAVVVEELFSSAQTSVLVVGFVLQGGQRLLRRLADSFDSTPSLEVTLCLDVSRQPGDTSRDDNVVARFADRFKKQEWPGRRLPKVYFDPRALAPWREGRAVLHAKCVAVDDRQVLVTSANLTVAAQSRNIELGLLVRAPAIASAVRRHFEQLVACNHLRCLPL